MRAIVSDGTGWRLDEQPIPVVHDGEVLVAVRAVAMNNADRAASPAGQVVGYEFAGEIMAVGSAVADRSVGDRVMGTVPSAFAELLAVDARLVVPVPEGIGWVQAAALPTGLLTEYGALTRAGFQPGDKVLTTAATSGIAMIGLQLIAALGGIPIATTRSAEQRSLLESLGADQVVVGSGAELTEPVLSATSGQGASIVLDHVGGDTLVAALAATARGGTVVNVGQLGQRTAVLDLGVLTGRQLQLIGVSYGFSDLDQIGGVFAALTPQVLPLVASGRIRPVVTDTFPFEQPDLALAATRRGGAPGKLVLEVASDIVSGTGQRS